MKTWILRAFRALVFGVLTAGFVAVMRTQTGGDAEPISDLAVRAVAYAVGYFIADAFLSGWRTRRRKVNEMR
jgi:glycerol uptake facilitator-like aquaporin